MSWEPFIDIVGLNFKQPAEGLGFDNSPTAHMWRTHPASDKLSLSNVGFKAFKQSAVSPSKRSIAPLRSKRSEAEIVSKFKILP
jgi:hypothetical protein